MVRIIALHGFLGSPADFLPLQLANIFAPNLSYIASGPLTTWALRFNRHCPDNAVLLGYSLGGRLALHAVIAAPQKYRAAIILAANPGLPHSHERKARYMSDGEWAQRFLTMPWDELMTMWNSQPILQSSKPKITSETDFSRKTLACYLRYFSLGEQQQLTPQINSLDFPLLWLAPMDEARTVAGISFKNHLSELILIREGGHRFFLDQPLMTARYIKQFLHKIAQIKRCDL